MAAPWYICFLVHVWLSTLLNLATDDMHGRRHLCVSRVRTTLSCRTDLKPVETRIQPLIHNVLSAHFWRFSVQTQCQQSSAGIMLSTLFVNCYRHFCPCSFSATHRPPHSAGPPASHCFPHTRSHAHLPSHTHSSTPTTPTTCAPYRCRSPNRFCASHPHRPRTIATCQHFT